MKGMFLWGSGGRLTTIVNIVVISVHHCIARCIVHRRIMRFVLVEVIQHGGLNLLLSEQLTDPAYVVQGVGTEPRKRPQGHPGLAVGISSVVSFHRSSVQGALRQSS